MLLQRHPAISIMRVSSLYRTSPVGYLGAGLVYQRGRQFADPTGSAGFARTFACRWKKSFGRVRTVKWGPRPLDLDILFYENDPN